VEETVICVLMLANVCFSNAFTTWLAALQSAIYTHFIALPLTKWVIDSVINLSVMLMKWCEVTLAREKSETTPAVRVI